MKVVHLLLISIGLFLFRSNEIQAGCNSVYIVNQNDDTIRVFDIATNSFITSIDVLMGMVGPFSPREIAFTPDRTRAFTSNQSSSNVSVIDPAFNIVIAVIPVPGTTLTGIAASSTHVYAGSNGSSTVDVIEIASNSFIATIPVSGQVNEVAITQDETRIYVTTSAGFVDVIDIPSNVLVASVPVGALPNGIALTAKNAYVVNQASNDISIINLTTLLPVTLPLAPIVAPQDIAITPDGTKAYIATLGTDALYIFDIATNTVSGTTIPFPGGSSPSYSVNVTPDGTKVYVTHNSANTMSIVDVATNSITTTGAIFSGPFGIGFSCSGLVTGACKKDIFLTQIDLSNQIRWAPISSSVPVQYKIFRNGALIGTVPSTSPLEFQDPNRKKNRIDVYSVYAETSNNLALVGTVSVRSCQ